MLNRHRIQFPKNTDTLTSQDKAFFILKSLEENKNIKFHSYAEIYEIPGLYEQVFYDRLKCCSPNKITNILKNAIHQSDDNFTELRVLDFGAGNGIMGEELKTHGVSRLIGIDILEEAAKAANRDRPDVYDAYYIADFTNLDEDTTEEITSWECDCMVTVAALGFGDIPPKAFLEAFNIIRSQGWVAFNIKETFLDNSDTSGFSRMIRELIFSEYLDIYCIERYRHRLSIDGEPLYYFAIVGRKNADAPKDFLSFKNIATD